MNLALLILQLCVQVYALYCFCVGKWLRGAVAYAVGLCCMLVILLD